MLKLIKSKHYKKLKEDQRKYNIISSLPSSQEKLFEKRGVLLMMIKEIDTRLRAIDAIKGNITKSNGKTLKQYKKKVKKKS
jgi:RNA-binding protein YhbY